MTSPYSGLPAHHFWRHAVERVNHHVMDAVVATRFRIEETDRIATAGSCFAQHIARHLQQLGNNYSVTETGADLDSEARAAGQYGLFSARYGNIYTAAQLWQLHQRAYGTFAPADVAWETADGRWIDPFRQTVEPQGFASIEALRADHNAHFAAVRTLFEQCDILIFTLGLTEGWRSRRDGAVYSSAPGVVAGDYDPADHAFFNASLAETERDLAAFFSAVKERNPLVKVVLTVSPVALAATYEKRSALVSNSYSKAVLRVAADNLMRCFDWIDYFPSYKIILGNPARGIFYEDDDRQVRAIGVAHVMRLFTRHYITKAPGDKGVGTGNADLASATGADGIVCEESMISAMR